MCCFAKEAPLSFPTKLLFDKLHGEKKKSEKEIQKKKKNTQRLFTATHTFFFFFIYKPLYNKTRRGTKKKAKRQGKAHRHKTMRNRTFPFQKNTQKNPHRNVGTGGI